MPASLRDLPCCAQCGQPMDAQAAAVGCLHCLLGDMLAEEPPAAPRPASTREPARFHHYELCRREDGGAHELGRGAMGVTYKALDVNLQVPVALKVINPRYSAHPQARERFLREARAAARLQHPNVAAVYHYGTTESDAGLRDMAVEDDPAGNHCFYAMEFIEGETLEARLRRDGPLPAVVALEIARQVATALEAAEKRGLVHRDLKPANLMLAAEGGAAWVKVIDFGLAKAVSAATGGEERGMASTAGGFVGTPQFASPEQFERAEVDVRSDVYSLGVTLWYALTGHAPYEGDTPAAVHDRQVHRPLPVAQLSDHDVPAPVVELLASMLAPDPTRRPASAAALREAVERCLAAVTAPRSRLWHPHGAAIVALGLAGLVGLMALAALLGWRHFRPAPPASRTVAVGNAPSVAVLPFENRSAQPDTDYFAAGVQDEILSLLARVGGLKVIGRGSVARYAHTPDNLPEVARQLGVANVVEGSVQKVGDHVHVNVQLIQAEGGTQLWADSYDLQINDLFAVEARVAHGVANALAVHLAGAGPGSVPNGPTSNPAAYDAYLRGLADTSHASFHTDDVLAAQRHFGEAVRLDPDFALAWAELSLVDSWGYYSGWMDPTPALRDEARIAAENALRLQPALGEALMANGAYFAYCLSDRATALRFYDQARPLLPNNSTLPRLLADLHTDEGDFDAARRDLADALRVDPRNVRLLFKHASMLPPLRRFAEAVRGYGDVAALAPDPGDALSSQAGVLLATGDLAAAAAVLDPGLPGRDSGAYWYNQMTLYWLQRRPERAVTLLKQVVAGRANMKATSAAGWLALLGRSQKLAGDPEADATLHDARRELDILAALQPDNAYLATDLARVCAAQGDHDAALAAARRAVALKPLAADQSTGRCMLDVLAEVAAQVHEPDLAIGTLQGLRHAHYQGATVGDCPITAATLRLYPMFDALRGDARFQALCRDD